MLFFCSFALLVLQVLWFRFLLFDFIFLPFRLIILRIGTALIVRPFVGEKVTVVLCEDVCKFLFPIPSFSLLICNMRTSLFLILLLAMCMMPLKTFRIFSICPCLFFFLFCDTLLDLFADDLPLGDDSLVQEKNHGTRIAFRAAVLLWRRQPPRWAPKHGPPRLRQFDTSGFRPTRSAPCVREWAEEPSWRGAATRHVRC